MFYPGQGTDFHMFLCVLYMCLQYIRTHTHSYTCTHDRRQSCHHLGHGKDGQYLRRNNVRTKQNTYYCSYITANCKIIETFSTVFYNFVVVYWYKMSEPNKMHTTAVTLGAVTLVSNTTLASKRTTRTHTHTHIHTHTHKATLH